MHKNLIKILLFTLLSSKTLASGLPGVGNWYIGTEVGGASRKIADAYENNSLSTGDLVTAAFVGKKFDRFGFEVGMIGHKNFLSFKTSDTQKDVNYYADALYYTPIVLSFNGLAGVGVGLSKTSFDNGTIDDSSFKLTPRAMLGVQFNIIAGLHTRLMLRRQYGNNFYDYSDSVALGILFRL